MIGYLNSDWAKDHVNQKFTFKFIFILNRGSVSYVSKKQTIIILPFIKAKYITLSLVVEKTT